MKFNKWIIGLAAVAVLAFTSASKAQTLAVTNVTTQTNITIYAANPTNSATLQAGLGTIMDALSASVSNSYFVVYGMHAKALPKAWGGGVGWFNPLSQYFVTGVRVDYVDGSFWMPSGSATLQLPIKFSGITLTPLAYAGVGVPLSGAKISLGNLASFTVPGTTRDNNGQVTAITGVGLSVDIYNGANWNLKAVYDAETWTGFSGVQQRFGLGYHSNKAGLFGMGLNLGVIKL